MGIEIVKCARDGDLYIEWDSREDAPTFVGDRAETLAYLAEQDYDAWNQPEDRLRRADESGTSMLDRSGCDWTSPGLTYRQRGTLPRHRFAAFARAILDDASEDVLVAMLDPLEDRVRAWGARLGDSPPVVARDRDEACAVTAANPGYATVWQGEDGAWHEAAP